MLDQGPEALDWGSKLWDHAGIRGKIPRSIPVCTNRKRALSPKSMLYPIFLTINPNLPSDKLKLATQLYKFGTYNCLFIKIHRRTGTFGLRGGGDLFARKNYTMPECLSFAIEIQKYLYSMKRKYVYNSHT